jgi:dihydrofolate reductase
MVPETHYSRGMNKPKICAVMAIGRNRELGKGNKLLWHIPDDLKRFRALTKGHPLIMGRKTFESILSYRGSPLPDRTNIVITHDPNRMIDLVGQSSDVIVVPTLEVAIEKAKELDSEEIHIGGGASIYESALPSIDKLYLTLIEAEASDADTFFPPYEDQFTRVTFEEEHEWKGIKYKYVNLERA